MKVYLIPLILISLVSISCSSSRLVPFDYSAERPGETLAHVNDGEAELFLEHIPSEGDQMVFDLEVFNDSHEPFELDPHAIVLYRAQQPFPAVKDGLSVFSQSRMHSGHGGTQAAPQEEVNNFFRKRIRSQRAAQTALLVIGVALAVNDAIQDSKDWNQEFWTHADVQRAATRDAVTFGGLVAADLISQTIEAEKIRTIEDLQFLPDEYLSKTIIYTKASARGRLYFQNEKGYSHYRIIVPLEGKEYIFEFRQPNGEERHILNRIR